MAMNARCRPEDLAQRRNALALAGVERAELREGLAYERPAAVRGALERGIVEDDELAINEIDIDLDPVRAELERAANRAQRILRLITRGAAMADAEEFRHARWCNRGPHGRQRRSLLRGKRDAADAVIAERKPKAARRATDGAAEVGVRRAFYESVSEIEDGGGIAHVKEPRRAKVE